MSGIASFALACLFKPQFISNAGAALVFATPGSPAAVPDKSIYQLLYVRVANVTASPADLNIWRVPAGSSVISQNLVVPGVTIPPANINTFPYWEVTTLWGITLTKGDVIWAASSVANALTIHGDGSVTVIPTGI